MKKSFALLLSFLFCNATHAAVYLIDFKCEQEAYEVFASMTSEKSKKAWKEFASMDRKAKSHVSKCKRDEIEVGC